MRFTSVPGFSSVHGLRSEKFMSAQLWYGARAELPDSSKNARRAPLRPGMPVSRARAMLIVARSRGSPSRLLRSASVTNSSIWLPTWRDMPRTTAPAAWSGVNVPAVPPLKNSGGSRKASMSPMSLLLPSAFFRATVSVSMEWPKR